MATRKCRTCQAKLRVDDTQLEAGFEGLRSEVKNVFLSFKEEIVKLFSGKDTPRQDTDDDVTSVISPTRTGVDGSEGLDEDSVEEDDSLVEFKRRLSRIEGTKVKENAPTQATATVSQGN